MILEGLRATLRTLSVVGVVPNPARYYRKVTETALRWYLELEDGIIQSESGPVFDARILEYRVDVDLVLDRFDPREKEAILLIHRDGCSNADALALAGLPSEKPDRTIAEIEARMGRLLEQRHLGEFLRYVNCLR